MKFLFIFFVVVLSVMASLVHPSRVFADDGLPPVESTPQAPGEEPLTTEPVQEIEETPASVAEVMDDSSAVLTDENGDPIPLASEQALEYLSVPDPYIIRLGVTYRFLPLGGCFAFPGDPNCFESSTPIQAAIDYSVSGETVFVDPGTYIEQLVINKDIVLQATAPGAIIKSPDTLTNFFMSGSNRNYPIVYVHDTADASIIGFTIDGDNNGDGNYRFDGVGYYNAGGTIQGNTIQNIMNSTFSGTQHGAGIFIYAPNGNPYDIVIDDNVIKDYQKNGMTLSGANVTAEITNNTVIGAGPTSVIAQNGIQVSGGADALIQGNTVTGNVYIPDTTVSTGILFFGPGDVEIVDNTLDANDINAYVTGAGAVEVTGNTISNAYWNGIWVDSSGATTITGNQFMDNAEGIGFDNMLNMPGVEISGNVFTGNTLAISNYDTVDVDATGNFWGCPTGPDDPACDQVSDYVIYDPWLTKDPFEAVPGNTDSGKRLSSSLIPVTGGGELVSIRCDADSTTIPLDEIEVVFSGLCGYEAMLQPVELESLPGPLNNNEIFLAGLAVFLFNDGSFIEELPANATVTISFRGSGIGLKWSLAEKMWQEAASRSTEGRTEVSAGLGTFVLIEK